MKVFHFLIFFELVMPDPNRGIPLKTPQNPARREPLILVRGRSGRALGFSQSVSRLILRCDWRMPSMQPRTVTVDFGHDF